MEAAIHKFTCTVPISVLSFFLLSTHRQLRLRSPPDFNFNPSMASGGSIRSDGGVEEVRTPAAAVHPAKEEPILPQSDSETDDDEAVVALKDQGLGSGSNPADEVSDCSSPSASAFMIVPSSKPKRMPRDKKKTYTEQEEITLLEGLAKFWEKGRNNKWAGFHSYIRESLLPHEFTKIQIAEKIRGLKRKYDNNVVRAKVYGRLDLVGHEKVLFELSQKLWDDALGIPFVVGDGENVGGDTAEKVSAPKRKAAVGEGTSDEENRKSKKQEQAVEYGKEDFEAEFPLLCASFETFGCPKFVRDICHWMGRDKAREMEEKLQELKDLELAFETKRVELTKRDLLDL